MGRSIRPATGSEGSPMARHNACLSDPIHTQKTLPQPPPHHHHPFAYNHLSSVGVPGPHGEIPSSHSASPTACTAPPGVVKPLFTFPFVIITTDVHRPLPFLGESACRRCRLSQLRHHHSSIGKVFVTQKSCICLSTGSHPVAIHATGTPHSWFFILSNPHEA